MENRTKKRMEGFERVSDESNQEKKKVKEKGTQNRIFGGIERVEKVKKNQKKKIEKRWKESRGREI